MESACIVDCLAGSINFLVLVLLIAIPVIILVAVWRHFKAQKELLLEIRDELRKLREDTGAKQQPDRE